MAAGARVTVVDTRPGEPVAGSRAHKAQADGITVLRGFVPVQAKGAAAVTGLVVRQMVRRQGQRGDTRTGV